MTKRIVAIFYICFTAVLLLGVCVSSFVTINYCPVFATPEYVNIYKGGSSIPSRSIYNDSDTFDQLFDKLNCAFTSTVLNSARNGKLFNKTKIEKEGTYYGVSYHINTNASKVYLELCYSSLQNAKLNGVNFVREDYNVELVYYKVLFEFSNISSQSEMKIFIKSYSYDNECEFNYVTVCNQGDMFDYINSL